MAASILWRCFAVFFSLIVLTAPFARIVCQESAHSQKPIEKTESEQNDIVQTSEDQKSESGQPLETQNTEVGSGTDNTVDQSKSLTDSTVDDQASNEDNEERSNNNNNKDYKFFSLTNFVTSFLFVKSFLNPFIHEFQEGLQTDKEGNETSIAAQTESILSMVVPGNSSNGNEKVANKENLKNGTEGGKKYKFQCVGKNLTANATFPTPVVDIVNGTVLIEMLSFNKNYTSSDCVLVLFYAPWCHFCAKTAPHYNAMARAFPQLEVLAVDVAQFSNLNARFGTVAVPNIMLFHISKSAVRFNHTERNYNTFIQFMKNVTGLDANSTVNVTESDYIGPVSSIPTEETDYLLCLAWIFVIGCSGWMFVHSHYGQQSINKVRILWQEHQHIE